MLTTDLPTETCGLDLWRGCRWRGKASLRLSSPACRGKYLASPMTAGLVGANGFAAIPTGVVDFKRLF